MNRIARRTAVSLLAAAPFLRPSFARAEAENVSPVDSHPRKRVTVLDSEMSYVDTGSGDPIVFLHGNPTWSYLWRNVITGLAGTGRLLAPDLIGMGRSKPAPDGDYRFAHHARYLDAWFDAVGATKNVTLVIHDWGSVLGFHRIARFPEQVRAVAYMEAIVMDRTWAEFGPFEQTFRAIRSPAGEEVVLKRNLFVESVLPQAVLRKLTAAELDAYRSPYPTPESRRPTLAWPREIPVDGRPADVAAIVAENGRALAASRIPKVFFNASPGTMPPRARAFCRMWPNQREIAIAGVHYVQEDSPNEIVAGVRTLLATAGAPQ